MTCSADELYRAIKNLPVRGTVKKSEPLSRHTTFRIGGPADVWVEPAGLPGLIDLIVFCRRQSFPLLVIGAGSNLLADDGGFRGVVVRLSRSAFTAFRSDGTEVRAGAGMKLGAFLRAAAAAGLGGAEFLSGIPGTVGGALAMNAGARRLNGFRRHWIGELVTRFRVADRKGKLRELAPAEAGFGYRTSRLEGLVIYEADFRLRRRKKRDVFAEIREILAARAEKQDLRNPSAGCVFKNPPGGGPGSGRLIDRAGLSGLAVGGAQVSRRHANFIINRGGATAADVRELMRLIRERIEKEYGLRLEPEIKIIGADKA